MPQMTGHTLKRVAKVRAMSCDLSPSSATKMTPKAMRVLRRTASTEDGPFGSGRDEGTRPRPGSMLPGSKVSPALPEQGRAAGPSAGAAGQYVDRDIGGYSPSLPPMVAVRGPSLTVRVDSAGTWHRRPARRFRGRRPGHGAGRRGGPG